MSLQLRVTDFHFQSWTHEPCISFGCFAQHRHQSRHCLRTRSHKPSRLRAVGGFLRSALRACANRPPACGRDPALRAGRTRRHADVGATRRETGASRRCQPSIYCDPHSHRTPNLTTSVTPPQAQTAERRSAKAPPSGCRWPCPGGQRLLLLCPRPCLQRHAAPRHLLNRPGGP